MYYLSLQWTNSFPPRTKPRHHPWYTSRRRRASHWKHRCVSLSLYAALSHYIIRPRTTALLRPHPKTGKATPTTLLRKRHFAGLPIRPSLYFGDSGETRRWQRSCLRTRVPSARLLLLQQHHHPPGGTRWAHEGSPHPLAREPRPPPGADTYRNGEVAIGELTENTTG